MERFELLIPPPALMAIFAEMMWGLDRVFPNYQVVFEFQISAAIFCVLLGLLVSFIGVYSFRKAKQQFTP